MKIGLDLGLEERVFMRVFETALLHSDKQFTSFLFLEILVLKNLYY